MTQPGVSGGESVPVNVNTEAPKPKVDPHYYDTFYVSKKVTVYRSPNGDGKRVKDNDWFVDRIYTDTGNIIVSNRAKQERTLDVRLLYKWNMGIAQGVSSFEYRGKVYTVVDFRDGVFQLSHVAPITEGQSISMTQNIIKTLDQLMEDDEFILNLPKPPTNSHI